MLLWIMAAPGTFLVIDELCTNKQKVLQAIHVRMPNGDTIKSTHTCELKIASLQKQARKGHIIPGLDQKSLLSTAQLCENGCKFMLKNEKCLVWHKQQLVLEGIMDYSINLWKVPIGSKMHQLPTSHKQQHQCVNVNQ